MEMLLRYLLFHAEMLDNRYPLATESNILKELIKPPSIVRNVSTFEATEACV